MNSVKTSIRCGERNEWGSGMSLYLGALALETSPGPLADVRIDARPHVASGEELLRCSHARVGNSMQRVKYSAPETLRDVWTRVAGGCVADEGGICGGQCEGSAGERCRACLEVAKLLVTQLGECHGVEIDVTALTITCDKMSAAAFSEPLI